VEVGPTAAAGRLGRADFGGGRSVGFSLAGAGAVPAQPRGGVAAFRSALPGVDLELEATGAGLKETIVLTRPNGPATFRFPLALEGLVASVAPGGSVELRDAASGAGVGRIPRGWMEDSALGPGVGVVSHAVTYELAGAGAGLALVVRLDRAWLDAPERVYPVRVDPTIQGWSTGTVDTYVAAGASSGVNFSTSDQLRAGYGRDANGFSVASAYLRFPTVGLSLNNPAYRILDTELHLRTLFSGPWDTLGSCEPRGLGLYPVTAAWDGPTMTANDAAPYDPARRDWQAFAQTGDATSPCPGGFAIYGEAWGSGTTLTELVRSWAGNEGANHGMALRVDPGSETDPYAFKIFKSAEAASEGPLLRVKFSRYGATYAPGDWATNPGPSDAGTIPVTVTNTGASTWGRYSGSGPADGLVRLAYHVLNPDGTTREFEGQRSELPGDVGPGQSVTVMAQVGAGLPFGQWSYIEFDLVAENVTWFSAEGIATATVAALSVGPLPRLTSATPSYDLAPVGTLAPTLSVTATTSNPVPLWYHFETCPASLAGCTYSGWISSPSWAVPPGANVDWGSPWYWTAYVSDGFNVTWMGSSPRFLTVVPQDAQSVHFGADPTSPARGGVGPATGNLTFAHNDLAMGGAGPAVVVARTYNSLDPRTGFFGPGWSMPYEMSATTEAGGNVSVRYPDGRTERYGRNPAGAPAPFGAPRASTNRLVAGAGGTLSLVRRDGSRYDFDAAGRLLSMVDEAGRTTTLAYNGAGQLATVTGVAGRAIT
ncbi:MAG: DUF6531 domain-containing protein, partial [Acidimicrobiales bacterium]